MNKYLLTLCVLLGVVLGVIAQSDPVFPPQQPPKKVQATSTTDKIEINGRLDEAAWQTADCASGFIQTEPYQGKPVAFDTKVWVLYNRKYLYFGVFSPDSLGRSGIRVPSMRRDFPNGDYDQVSLVFDPFRDKRNAVIFATHPFGAQRDLLSFDDELFDVDWDSYWRVRTSRTDSGWVAEFAVPWKTIRYPKDSTQWGFQVGRTSRRINQTSSWSPHPRSFRITRLAYAGLLTGLAPPPPSANIRIQPYLLSSYDHERLDGKNIREGNKIKIGGDVKWAIKPHTVLDLTFNTDFAQADADRQVQNLGRFSVFFPERRQFFLENASLFSPGLNSFIRPFFSRRIGLSPSGVPIPIDAGARLVNRTADHSMGAMVIRQGEGLGFPPMTAAVGRYTRNIGKQNRIGALVTARFDQGKDSLAPVSNIVGAVDGFFRLSQPLSFDFMLSRSATSGAGGDGLMGYGQFKYSTPQVWAYVGQSWVAREYNPALGFIYDSNLANTYLGGYLNLRPAWKPKILRSFEPDLNADFFHRASDRVLMQYQISTSPIFLNFQSGAIFYAGLIPTYQRLDLPFRPIGLQKLEVPMGQYHYVRYKVHYKSDQSKKVAYSLTWENGEYYTGLLQSWSASLRISPIPHIAVTLNYDRNQFQKLGNLEENKKLVTELLSPEVRLALNPRVQLIGFYQRNTALDRDIWNIRFSWEFQPLSFIYIVYNSNDYPVLTPGTSPESSSLRNEQVIGKITYLKQF